MVNSIAELEGTIKATGLEIAEIVATSLNGLGYSQININNQYRQATARERASKYYGPDRWDFDFRVVISWQDAPEVADDRVRVNVVVTENQYSHQGDACEERAFDLYNEFKRNAVVAESAKPYESHLYGSARWASLEELEQGGYLDPHDSNRFLIGRFEGREISVPERLTQEHVLVCGPTGAGKTRTIFIPNLVRRLGVSALVTEAASGENPPPLYTRTAGYRASKGHEIHYFNPSDLRSTRINPLDSVSTFDEANHICSLIIRNTSLPNRFGGDQIWEQSEIYLLNALILYVVGFREGERSQVGDGANLASIRSMLRAGPDEIRRRIETSRIELARKEYESFYKNTSPNFRYGVCSGLLVRLNSWVNPRIAALTEVTDFNEEELKEQLFTFYFVTSTKRPQHKPVAALAFNYVFDLLQSPGFKYPLALFLDELTNYGYVPDLPDKLTHIRNQGIGAVLGIQHHIQLSKVYQDKDAQLLMTQPGTRVFFRPRDVESATRISRSLGNTTVTQRKVSPGSAIHEDERMRPLLDPSEVERLEKGKVIVLTPSSNPVVLETFGPIEHDGFCELAPPERDEIEVDEGLRSTFRHKSEAVDSDGVSIEKPDNSEVSETGSYNNESDDDGMDWDRDLV